MSVTEINEPCFLYSANAVRSEKLCIQIQTVLNKMLHSTNATVVISGKMRNIDLILRSFYGTPK